MKMSNKSTTLSPLEERKRAFEARKRELTRTLEEHSRDEKENRVDELMKTEVLTPEIATEIEGLLKDIGKLNKTIAVRRGKKGGKAE